MLWLQPINMKLTGADPGLSLGIVFCLSHYKCPWITLSIIPQWLCLVVDYGRFLSLLGLSLWIRPWKPTPKLLKTRNIDCHSRMNTIISYQILIFICFFNHFGCYVWSTHSYPWIPAVKKHIGDNLPTRPWSNQFIDFIWKLYSKQVNNHFQLDTTMCALSIGHNYQYKERYNVHLLIKLLWI